MFMSEVNYTSMESSPQEEISNSDVENVAMSPDNNRIDVVNVESLPFDDRSSIKSGRNGDCNRSWTMAKVQVGYDITRKGERSLVVDGFKFTKSRDGTNNRVFWRCSRRECKATAVTVCDRVEHVRAIHAHEPPLAAEFFGSQEGVSQRCQLQEVRFNTSAANMRPRYRRSTVSGSEGNTEDLSNVKDISISNTVSCDIKPIISQNITQSKPLLRLVSAQPVFQINNTETKSIYPTCNGLQRTPSVKEQVRDFILRNSNAQSSNQADNNVSVAQFLISPASQTQFIQTNTTPVSSNSTTGSTIFNFSTMQINASPNAGSDSTSDAPSHKSTPGLINMPATPRDDSQYKNKLNDGAINQLNIEQIIQLLRASSRQRSCSDSEWVAANSSSTVSYDHDPQELSPSVLAAAPTMFDDQSCFPSSTNSNVTATSPARFLHWKKEKLRESETFEEEFRRDRKRRHDDISEFQQAPAGGGSGLCGTMVPGSSELFSFLNSFRPTITHKLMGVMQKLSSELCPEEAVAQEVFEKCTAIKTCLETLEKLHSLMSC